ncbi:MAG: DUF1553 domain-containing protein [Patescibacteria group bacterium]|nr:DUF1553 domain-containing protein [Patescibacteria group bacterium]
MVLLTLGALAACGMVAVAIWVVQSNQEALASRPAVEAPEVVDTGERWSRDRTSRRSRHDLDDTPLVVPDWNPNAQSDAGFHRTFETEQRPSPRGKLDELVFAKWKQMGIEPANMCSDAVFLRRAYLDLIGTLPTVGEARDFLKDESADKRAKLVDALLERPEYADYWAMKWSDILRVKAEFPINLWPNASQAYHRWLRHSMTVNMPYDQFVRELLTSTGSNFRQGQVNFFRAVQGRSPQGIAQAVALAFMGSRADKWPTERLDGMAAFFTKIGYKATREWKEEIIIFDPYQTSPIASKTVFPDGTTADIPADQDPRVAFADWLIAPENPWFSRHIVNRVWFWVMGRGIVHEPDDIRPDNPPTNPELLNYMAEELVKANYDLKHIYRLILNSSTYQLSPIPKSEHPEASAYFASYPVRRLEAEVMIDALNQITGTTEFYSSIIPEPYTFIPQTRRAIALPDGSIISSFLELFGRPPRDTGFESERNNNVTAGQRLHMLNSSHIRNKLRDAPGIKNLIAEGNARENLYLAILSRFPGEDYGGGGGDQLAWILINTTEFMFRH